MSANGQETSLRKAVREYPYRGFVSGSLGRHVRLRLLDNFHHATPPLAVVVDIVAALVLVVVFGIGNESLRLPLGLWFWCIVASNLFSMGVHAAYRRRRNIHGGAAQDIGRSPSATKEGTFSPDVWAWIFTLSLAITGLVWGSFGYFFFQPSSVVWAALPFIVLCAVVSAAAVSKSALLGAVLLFVLFSLLGLFVRIMELPDPERWGVSLTLVAYAASLFFFARGCQRTLLRSVGISNRNLDLLGRVSRSEGYFRTLVEHVSDMIMWLDQRGRIGFHSAATRRLLGCEEQDLVGARFLGLLHPEDRGAMLRAFEELRTHSHATASREVRMRDASGGWRYFLVHGRIVPGMDGMEEGIVLSIQDATEQREIQSTLRRAKDRAEEAGRAKSNFLATMSHEIRTPMSGIIGLIDLLKATEMSPKQQEYVRALDRAGEHLSDLLNDILDFSKIEANKLETETVAFDLRRMVGTVLDIFRAKATAKSVTLRARIAPDLPRRWEGDVRHLRQVVANLMGNAVKFTDSGHIDLVVSRLRDLEDGRAELLISVEDTGIGIVSERQSSIFEPFAQADTSSTRRYGGSGLGLAISRRLVELMGGVIGVESTPGQGSRFFFTVPLRAASLTKSATELRPRLEGEVRRFAPSRVLVVDDADLNRLVMGDMLSGLGLVVDMAINGAEAVEKFRSVPDYALVFLDIQMPVMDGFTAVRLMRQFEAKKERAHCPIVALSATALKEDRDAALAAGCDEYLVKPLRKDALIAFLKRTLPATPSIGEPLVLPVSGEGDHVAIIEPELASLLPSFFVSVDQDMAALSEAFSASDVKGAMRLAHTLKGNAMLFGFDALSSALRDLEMILRDATDADVIPDAARASFARVSQMVEAFHTRENSFVGDSGGKP